MAFDAITTVKEYSEAAQNLIDTGLFRNLISGVYPDSPWSAQSLNSCEKSFLNQYAEHPEKGYGHYLLFIGEGLRRTFGGQWATGAVMDSGIEGMDKLIGIYYPNKHFDVLTSLLDTSIAYGNGKTWSALFTATRRSMEYE